MYGRSAVRRSNVDVLELDVARRALGADHRGDYLSGGATGDVGNAHVCDFCYGSALVYKGN